MPLHPHATVIEVLTSGLAPYLGPSVARSAVRGVADKVAVGGAALDDAAIARILRDLGPGLAVFVGRGKAEEIMGGIRQKLALGRSS